MANVFYPLKTLAQTPFTPSATTRQPDCLSGYPNGTLTWFLRPVVTRNEFAAGLNGSLNQVNQLVPINKADLATREDFQVLIARQIELNRQLQELNKQVGNSPAQK